MSSRRPRLHAQPVVAGVALGLAAQLLRQIPDPFMDLGAATAPWVSVGFAVAVWATRSEAAFAVGARAMGTYLFAWLVAYHGLFAVRESVGVAAGWREAAPWLVAAVPVCLVLGLVAARAHRKGILGDACLALPLAWSLPEIADATREGWPSAAAVALPIAVLAALPLAAVARRRDVRIGTVTAACVVLGIVVFAVASVVAGQTFLTALGHG